MSSKIRILCVDDHPVVLDGLSLLIERQDDMEVVGFAASGERAIELFQQLRPDVTLMDLQLPTMSGIEAIEQICHETPDARIVVLTMRSGDEDVCQALEAGAATYLLKETLAENLVRVIRDVNGGLRPMPPNVVALLEARKARPSLTAREVDVVRLIAQGLRNKEIAVGLGISEETVKVHVRNILAKLNVNDRSAVITIALRRGIIHID